MVGGRSGIPFHFVQGMSRFLQNELRAYFTRSMIITGGVVCSQVVNTSNSGSGGSGFKPRPSRCFLRQGTLLHFVSVHPGV